jgi:DNA primase
MGKKFDRSLLPDPLTFYEVEGLTLKGPGRWKTTRCIFHGGSDSMRIKVSSGAFKCMACQVHGGDVLAYAMQAHQWDFAEAAEKLGAMLDDGTACARPAVKRTLSASAALKLLQREAMVVAMTGLSIQGVISDAACRKRLLDAVRVIENIMQEHAA